MRHGNHNCSNVTAHIAGALKIKVFLLLPKFRGRIWYWEDHLIFQVGIPR
jgi:hypothetical protein